MRTWLISLAASAALLTGCSGVSVRSTTTPGANLSQYRTYQFAQSPDQAAEAQTPASQQFRASLEQNLAQKGLMPAPQGTQPDFLIAYHTRQRQEVNVSPGYYGAWGWGGYPDITTYTQGTLIVDFIDPRTNQVFWRGTAQGVVNHPDNPNLAKIDKAVGKLVDRYPAQLAGAQPPTEM